MSSPSLEQLRKRFFIEVWQPEAFTNRAWRGCALNRDDYDNTRMPKQLFEAIVAVTAPEAILVATDEGTSLFASLEPTWDAFKRHMLDRNHRAIDYVISDASGRWACLADFDVTTFGAEPELATKIDERLSEHGMSFLALTVDAFGDVLDDPHVQSILGDAV